MKWRSADGTRLRRRLGADAWVVRDEGGRWRPREGRPTAGQLTEFQARRRVVAFIEAEEASRAEARALAVEEAAREENAGGPTFRALAHAWLEHLELVQSAKPSTMRDYRSMLAEPGTPYRRGRGRGRPHHVRARQPPRGGGHDGACRGAASRARARGRRPPQHQ